VLGQWLAWTLALAPAEIGPADPAIVSPWLDLEAQADEEEDDHQHLLHGNRLPSLLDFSRIDWTLEAYGLQASPSEFTTDARLFGAGEIAHPFDSEIQDVSLAIGLYRPAQAQEAFERLTKPPLHLTQTELDRPMPQPMATQSSELTVASLEPGHPTEVSFQNDLGQLSLSWHDMPAYIVLSEGYSLVSPTPEDVLLILERGGMADHAALSRWADSQDTMPAFPSEARREIMDKVRGNYRSLRAPPALGDFHRLSALVALIRTFGGSEDIEPLLDLERPIKILHTSALLSYETALREEAFLGLPVHGMRELPSRSKFLEAPDSALKALRTPALHHLLRLAFDPIDFRDAPAAMAANLSPLASQATNLLDPLTPTDVNGVLKAAGNDLDLQREVMRFYLDAHHAPAVEHLVEWLCQNPSAIDDVGMLGVHNLPDAMLAALMHHYVDPREPEHRAIVRRMLEAMPDPQATQVLQMLRSLGLRVAHLRGTPHEQMVAAFDEFEQAERRLATEKAAELLHQLRESGTDVSTLRSSMRAASRLAQLDPTAIETHAQPIIEILEAAAWEFDIESPAERTKALGYLETLPWGTRKPDAELAIAVTQARLLTRQGRSQEALDHLLAFDPKLDALAARRLFVDTLTDQFFGQIGAGAYGAASKSLALASEHVPQNVDVEILRRDLLWAQYKPAFILGAAFALALVTTITWLAAQGILGFFARLGRARQDEANLRRRQADARANSEAAASFSDGGQIADAAVQLVDSPSTRPKTVLAPLPDEPSPDLEGEVEQRTIAIDTRREPAAASQEAASIEPRKVDDALLGEFAVDEAFDDPFDDFNDLPFGDEFGWGDATGDGARHR